MKIAIGADAYGFKLKEVLKIYLKEKGIEVIDVGINEPESETPYYEIASLVAQKVSKRSVDRGVLVCGTGMGMAIIANKFSGVYASVCENTYSAEKSRSINNSNVITMGEFITAPHLAKDILDIWLNTEFTQGWEKPMKEWLHNSMKDISKLESKQFK